MLQLSIVGALFCSLVCLSDLASAAKVAVYPVTRALTQNGLSKRDGLTSVETLINNVSYSGYYASVEVGTPAQKLSLYIGLASSDVWIVDSRAPVCSNNYCRTPCKYACSTITFD
jgi:hypothetical protein